VTTVNAVFDMTYSEAARTPTDALGVPIRTSRHLLPYHNSKILENACLSDKTGGKIIIYSLVIRPTRHRFSLVIPQPMMTHPAVHYLAALCRPLSLTLAISLFVPLSVGAGETTTTVRPATPAFVIPSERAKHLTELGVDRWLSAGTRGSGIKVAILDTGLRGYKDHLGKSLPAKVTTHSFRKDGNLEDRDSQHGILCAEVVHALAPDAKLLLANWDTDDPESFLKAVKWARSEGANVITCSVIMPHFSDGEGGGTIHEALAQALGTGKERNDVLFFASAGNTAQRHWWGRFHADNDGFHEWKAGVMDNILTPWGDEKVAVELCCKTGSSYEIVVFDKETGAEVARTPESNKLKGGSSVLRFDPKSGHNYRLRVRLVGGTEGTFHILALHSGLSEATPAGSVAFPADGPEVVAVGAVDHDGKRASYSACGSDVCSSKPDLVAPVPFVSSWRERPFAGTSAASPQAAALAALVWSRNPDWTAERVRSTLGKSARDLGPPGHDTETGFGVIRLP
jgi:subtilisin family serine protease